MTERSMLISRQPGLYRFGIFEADCATGELRKAGARVRLQDQPFAVPMVLLERPGQLVTREDLRQKLWSGDTFVDFDHSLNTAITKLREALGDAATNPRFIETLARRGYRFIAPVQRLDNKLASVPAWPMEPAATSSGSDFAILTRPADVPPVPRGYVRALFGLIQIMYLVFYVVALTRLHAVDRALEQAFGQSTWLLVAVVVTAVIGVPIRLFLLSAAAFNIWQVSRKFARLFPVVIVLDGLWALSPFLVVSKIGWGGALAATAALLYVPFSQRTLLLMGERASTSGN
ncbi:MAG: winged helix-turn-helix domain-containing protein [Terriglobales bacterium]